MTFLVFLVSMSIQDNQRASKLIFEMMPLQFDGKNLIDFPFFSRLQHPRNIWLVSRWRRVTSYGSILSRREVLGARLSRRNPLHLSSLKWIQKISSHGPLSCKLLLFFKKSFFFCIIFHNGIENFYETSF